MRCAIGWRTVGRRQRRHVAGPNLQSTFIGCCDSSHLRCAEHFNCANWTASPFAKPRMFSESLKARGRPSSPSTHETQIPFVEEPRWTDLAAPGKQEDTAGRV